MPLYGNITCINDHALHSQTLPLIQFTLVPLSSKFSKDSILKIVDVTENSGVRTQYAIGKLTQNVCGTNI